MAEEKKMAVDMEAYEQVIDESETSHLCWKYWDVLIVELWVKFPLKISNNIIPLI
jgi:hypothetical protein